MLCVLCCVGLCCVCCVVCRVVCVVLTYLISRYIIPGGWGLGKTRIGGKLFRGNPLAGCFLNCLALGVCFGCTNHVFKGDFVYYCPVQFSGLYGVLRVGPADFENVSEHFINILVEFYKVRDFVAKQSDAPFCSSTPKILTFW